MQNPSQTEVQRVWDMDTGHPSTDHSEYDLYRVYIQRQTVGS